MPTYDYLCQACGHAFELFQQMTDPVKKKCPECSKLKLRRLIGTGSGVIFKGGGFYETDYRSDSYKKGAEDAKKSSEKKTDDKKASKSDSKKESVPEKKSAGEKSSSASKPTDD
ncbi:MAG: zinc ribbon domain-containing protein [Planctomycetes bacterium]|nr:zinc ribbon domain-containing protein [Planctomycetota bacterium]